MAETETKRNKFSDSVHIPDHVEQKAN